MLLVTKINPSATFRVRPIGYAQDAALRLRSGRSPSTMLRAQFVVQGSLLLPIRRETDHHAPTK